MKDKIHGAETESEDQRLNQGEGWGAPSHLRSSTWLPLPTSENPLCHSVPIIWTNAYLPSGHSTPRHRVLRCAYISSSLRGHSRDELKYKAKRQQPEGENKTKQNHWWLWTLHDLQINTERGLHRDGTTVVNGGNSRKSSCLHRLLVKGCLGNLDFQFVFIVKTVNEDGSGLLLVN